MCTIMAYQGDHLPIEKIKEGLAKTTSRGPDSMRITRVADCILGFQRLSIMGLSPEGMQPFEMDGNYVVCNGEIYCFRPIKDVLQKNGYKFHSESDCEIILPLYKEKGVDFFKDLDAEFAMVIFDKKTKSLIAARDPIGIRPLFYGYDKAGGIYFASEAKNLVGLVTKVMAFPPGHYYKDGKFVCYRDITKVSEFVDGNLDSVCKKIHDKLVKGVEKRLDSDTPVGFLLSGGLDSSLVCSIASKLLKKPIKTFAIGMSEDAIDLKYAKEVADYIHSDHTEVIINKDIVIQSLEKVISILGTFDITTIRASM